jgi:uncharacterized glyoxalase superfamily protein PhnB
LDIDARVEQHLAMAAMTGAEVAMPAPTGFVGPGSLDFRDPSMRVWEGLAATCPMSGQAVRVRR